MSHSHPSATLGIPLRTGLARITFLAGILALALPVAFLSARAWIAEHWASSADPALWGKAARLEPENADDWRLLGLYEQWRLGDQGVEQAIGCLQRAVRIDPRSATLWMDLAGAYEASGDDARAGESYREAQAAYPLSAEVAWRYGSFLLYQGRFSQGDAQMQRALLIEPSLAPSAIAECWQTNPDIGELLDRALPAQPPYYLAAVNFFLSQNQLDPALAVWRRELALGMPVGMSQAVPLVDALIRQNRLMEARQSWQQALRASGWPRDRGHGSSLVFNGGFEHQIVNGGFGWREVPAAGVRYARDCVVTHSGSHSLRVDFGGSANLDFQNVLQLVAVQPRTRYHFSAWLRTKGISTDHGIRFQIFDPQHESEVQFLTPNMIGTNPWTLVQGDFTTGKDTRLLEAALRRIFSWKFDNKIRGTAWVDDVALSAK